MVEIAQELSSCVPDCCIPPSFNPCVGRNSSGAATNLMRGMKLFCFNPCVGRNSSGAPGGARQPGPGLRVSIRVMVGIAQELPQPTPKRWPIICFNPCDGRNSSGAFWCHLCRGAPPVSIRVLVGIAQEQRTLAPSRTRNGVSIRVLVGTAQERDAHFLAAVAGFRFQSVYWSEQLRSPGC